MVLNSIYLMTCGHWKTIITKNIVQSVSMWHVFYRSYSYGVYGKIVITASLPFLFLLSRSPNGQNISPCQHLSPDPFETRFLANLGGGQISCDIYSCLLFSKLKMSLILNGMCRHTHFFKLGSTKAQQSKANGYQSCQLQTVYPLLNQVPSTQRFQTRKIKRALFQVRVMTLMFVFIH